MKKKRPEERVAPFGAGAFPNLKSTLALFVLFLTPQFLQPTLLPIFGADLRFDTLYMAGL